MEENKEERKKEEKGKKRIGLKVLAIIAIIISVMAIFVLINFVRNLVIINDMIAKQEEFKNSTNYSYTATYYDSNNEENKVNVQISYKDGKSRMTVDNGKDEITVWYDEKTKESIFLNEGTKEATVTTSEFMLGDELLYFYEEDNKMYYALTSLIVNSNINGNDCYKIIHSNYNTYINKEDGTVQKDVYKGAIVNNEKCDTISEYSNWKFNELTDEYMAKPDLTGYTVK